MPQLPSDQRKLSALPSPLARATAFVAIIIAGVAGAAIGYALTDLQCTGDCAVGTGMGLVVGAIGGALGMSTVAVLALRAVGEWREVDDK